MSIKSDLMEPQIWLGKSKKQKPRCFHRGSKLTCRLIGDEVAPASGAADVADSEVDHAVLGSAPKCGGGQFVRSDTQTRPSRTDRSSRPPLVPAHTPARLGDNSTQRCKLYTRTEVPITSPLPWQGTICWFSFSAFLFFICFLFVSETYSMNPRHSAQGGLAGLNWVENFKENSPKTARLELLLQLLQPLTRGGHIVVTPAVTVAQFLDSFHQFDFFVC